MKLSQVLSSVSVAVAPFALASLVTLTACSDDPAAPAANTATDAGKDTGSTGDDSGWPEDDAGHSASDAGDAAPPAAPTCAAYCTKIAAQCTQTFSQYPDEATCLKQCADLPLGAGSDKSGNTIGCRTYHAGNSPPATHCAHAGSSGGATCGSRCEAFCEMAMKNCSAAKTAPDPAAFTDKTDCMNKCDKYTFDTTKPELSNGGNTLNCRLYHLQASYGAVSHCQHLNVTSPPCQ